MGFRLRGRSKYGSTRVMVDNIVFDSQAEAQRYQELKILAAAGEIGNLRVHPVFRLQPGFRDCRGKWHRPICYEADFDYLVGPEGQHVVEDVKGFFTKDARMKVKMFCYQNPETDLRIEKASER